MNQAATSAEILSVAQMRAIEDAAFASGAVTGAALMERAGQGVVAAIAARWPGLAPGRVVVLCGPGNNGGDGYVIARLLQGQGWQVTLAALAPPVTADAAAMRALWLGPVLSPAELDWPQFRAADLVIDAMFGIGLARDIAPGVWGLLDMAQSCRARLVAVDIMSGLCADSGRVRSALGYVERPADLTVTFERAKPGHFLEPGGSLTGPLAVVPLGLQPQIDALLRGPSSDAVVELAAADPVVLAKGQGHKFQHGHAIVVSGPAHRSGAARLAARGALRIGAGLVTLAAAAADGPLLAGHLTAIMLAPLQGPGDLATLCADRRVSALCIGPGLGGDAGAAALLETALRSGRPLVIDADALTLLARQADLRGLLHDGCVLTPHAGEFARLCPDLAERLLGPPDPGPAFSKLEAAALAAARLGAVVLLKGPDTVIATPCGALTLQVALATGPVPWLATAGAGDVLAGFITGLLARGLPPAQAAAQGAWLHAAAARRFGPGLIAEDLPETLPAVLRDLGL